MFEKKERPAFMGICFDGISVDDYFSIDIEDLGENGLSHILGKARASGVGLSYKKSKSLIEFWCDSVSKKRDDLLEYITKEDFIPINEISLRSGIPMYSVKKQLSLLIHNGVVEFKQLKNGKKGRPTNVYRLK